MLHRTSRGWQQVGATPLDAPDLADALSYLRSTALGLSPRGLTTKLVIPNDLILYTTVNAPGPEIAKRRRQIKAALEGLTPYKADDLVFDWWGSGTEVQVAVVARETLAEAEAFATVHRLNPVSFVGAPENASYLGEPFFGPSALSATLLSAGEKVERDQDPVSVVARDLGKEPTPDASATEKPTIKATSPEKTAAQNTVTGPAPESRPSPASEVNAANAARQRGIEPQNPEPAAQAPAAVQPEIVVQTAPQQPKPITPAKASAPLPPVEPTAAANTQLDDLPDFGAPKGHVASSFDPATLAMDLVDEAPMAVDVAEETAPPPSAPPPAVLAEPSVSVRLPESLAKPPVAKPPVAKPSEAKTQALPDAPAKPTAKVADDLPPSPSSAVIASFASRRAGPTQAEADKQRKTPSLGAAPQSRPTVPRPAMAKPASAMTPNGLRDNSAFPAKPMPAATRFPPGKAVKPISSAPAGLQMKRDRNVVPLAKASAVAGEDVTSDAEAKPLTKGQTGLDGRPVVPRGKPRFLGLILTGLLLLALALVAAWSSYFLTSNDPGPNAAPAANAVADTATGAATPDAILTAPDLSEKTAAADLTAPDDSAASSTDPLPTPGDEALADGQAPLDTETTAADAMAADIPAADATMAEAVPPATTPAAVDPAATAALAPAAPVIPAPVIPQAAKPEPAPATLVSTEAAQVGSQGNDPQDEIFLADADIAPQTSDPLTLSQLVASNDAPPDVAVPPPPFGTLYTFDAEGRIQPTPEGIITPEGVLLVAGRPKVVPPTRPASTTTPTPDPGAPETIAPDVATADPAAAPAATADLGSTAAVTELPAAAAAASAALESDPGPFPSDPALAGKRPKPRPANLIDPTATTAKQGEAPTDALANRFASLRPQARPAARTAELAQTAEAAPDAELTNDAASASLAFNGVQPSTLAVSVSRKPASRPNSRDQAVDAAVAAAVRTPEPELQQFASAAPEAQIEPEVETTAPTLPTNASVAGQATTKDALNMSRVALLGIFGTASGRYAMIRQPGGGVKKVVVGDRLDGGQIAAITADGVQYQKGGRILTLSLPTG